jgi:hypothetical protein
MMQGFPISAKLPEDLGFGERFWYWRGASGRSYIHSIYQIGSCPPLAGAVFVLVRALDGRRRAVAAGRFPDCVEGRSDLSLTGNHGADEIHVHLLARDRDAACAVLRDLEDALHGTAAGVPQMELEMAGV